MQWFAYWHYVYLLLSVCVFYNLVLSEELKEGLPFCGIANNNQRYVFVSTLDGKLSAINADNGGSLIWSVPSNADPLLSSSIHRLELTNYAQFVRLIPSLNGGLYKFNGETVEPIPLSAEHLLQASFRYSDDLVISGGKESRTLGVSVSTGEVVYECSMRGCKEDTDPSGGKESRTLGVSVSTGEVVYECSMRGCKKDTDPFGGKESRTLGVSVSTGEVVYECSMRGCKEDTDPSGDILVVQRHSQVVRAVESRTGTERWNFSVAQHDLKLISECHSGGQSLPRLNLKVVVPEGLVCALDPTHPSSVLWSHKFDSPVVNIWEVIRGQIVPVDLFSTSSHIADQSPSLYIGMHEKQLYIQESVQMLKKRQELAVNYGQNLLAYEKEGPTKLPWRPMIANAKNAGLEVLAEPNENDTALEEVHTTALSVLYASPFVDGVGFYLYSQDKTDVSLCNVTISPEPELDSDLEETPVTIVIVSLWYWWKEVMVISITTALIFNLIFTRRLMRFRKQTSTASTSSEGKVSSDSGIVVEVVHSEPAPDIPPVVEYNSRYLTDFEPVHCLGHGGFGVVFQAKNKIDDCHYAIKRITLPDAVEQRERVMREVRALAKLDHNNIVRYFNAWLEDPPPGWQQAQDHTWNQSFGDTDSFAPSSQITETTGSRFPSHQDPSKLIVSCGGGDEDSFIVFASESQDVSSTKEKNGIREHSIRITESSGDCTEQKSNRRVAESKSSYRGQINKRRRQSKPLELEQNICNSPSKVYLYIQMQLCQRESLKDWLLKTPLRDFDEVIDIFDQIVKAVEYVHLNSLIHRDLKPSNIFFSMDRQIKVGDFGLVTSITEDVAKTSPSIQNKTPRHGGHTAQVGTHLYMSPEQLSGRQYNYKVDIFALGMILFELLVPFSTQMERLKILTDIKRQNFPQHFIEDYKDEFELLKLMLSPSPDERPTTVSLRSRPPLLRNKSAENGDAYFEFPPRRRESLRTSMCSVSSDDKL